MITNFGALYAGHVDLGDIGLEATALNDRNFSDDHLATIFDRATAIAQLMDRVGFDSFWMAEHHFQTEGNECIGNLLMLYLHLAHITENLKFGCGFNINPMWHPLRLAEDFATADRLTNGRVIFGVGRGYHSREVDTFGAPSTNTDSDANRELFEEQVEVIMKAFNNRSFSHYGKNYQIPPPVAYRGYQLEEITLVPRPRTLPVECWQPIVSAGQRAMDFMAKHRIKGIIGGGAVTGGASEEVVTRWRDTLIAHGQEAELGTDLTVGIVTYICDSEAQGIKECKKYFEEDMKMFAPLGFFRGMTDQQLSDLADPKRAPSAGLPIIDDAVKAGSWLCGPPELITERLMELQDKYPGLERVHVGCTRMGTPLEVILEQLERFGTEVMPKFKRQKA
ncbi:MAG TPA: LLM class flavin-dependent oxidoreductase [Dehalococcoidia bacterium]|nr:LLM class flavin-dependent oxidoreductase [Dehalococcoidia bacterium]